MHTYLYSIITTISRFRRCVSVGFWIGLASGLTFAAVVFFIILVTTNWEKQVQKVKHEMI